MNQTGSQHSRHSVAALPPIPLDNSGENYLGINRDVLSWSMTLDHKRISIMYLVAISLSFLSGLVFAMVLRAELSTAGQSLINADAFNRVFTLHGATMVFLVVIPAIPAVLGNFVLPLMLGAKSLAFPRLNLASFYLYTLGAVCFLLSMMQNGLDTGWTFAAPYVIQSEALGVVAVLIGAMALGLSSIFQGINFIVTIHRRRAPGMTWFRMPVFSWSLYTSSLVQVVTTPILVVALGLLIAGRAGLGMFSLEAADSDPLLYQRFFWFFAAPALLVMVLPAIGVVSELITIHSRKPLFGYRVVVGSLIAIAILSFSAWGRHWFLGGQSGLADTIFSLLTFGVALPVSVIIFNWLATMSRGAIAWNTPMVYAMMFICFMTIGGLSGLFLSGLATDIHLQGTMFEVAHLHYVMMGGVLIALLGALHHWWPKMTGRMYDEHVGLFCAFVVFMSLNVTFFPQFIMGSRGLPRQYFNYPIEFEILQKISTIGAVSLAMAFCVIPIYLFYSVARGPSAPANPWGGASLDWRCTSPPPFSNFDPEATPISIGAPYEYDNLEYNADIAGFVSKSSESNETLFITDSSEP